VANQNTLRAQAFRCNVCRETQHSLLYHKPFGRIFRCRACGVLRLTASRSHDAVTTDYGPTYFRKSGSALQRNHAGYRDYFGKEWRSRAVVHQGVAQIVTKLTDHMGSALDVGCGGGQFVYWLNRLGWAAEGQEVSPYAAGKARKLSNVTVHVTDIAGLRRTGRRYDLVTLFDVLEHFDNPVRELSILRAMLAPGGALFVSTPWYGGTMSKEQGPEYFQFKPDHLFYFSVASLDRALRAAGFEPWHTTVMTLRELLALYGDVPESMLVTKYSQDREQLFALARV
jgi:SAM-dependent methyltransferase